MSAINTAAIAKLPDDEHGDRRWISVHERYVRDCKRYEPNVVFIGDGLVERMQHTPIWKQFFEPLHCLNFGISNDKTQNVLWRIQNGELDNIKPKVIILLVGTNNYENNAEQVGEAIIELIKQIRLKQAKSHIIVLGIPPRGREMNRLREKNDKINSIVEKYCLDTVNNNNTNNITQQNGNNTPSQLTYLCCHNEILSTMDATISHHDMIDYLNLTNEGYRKFCEPIIEELQNILNISKD